MTKRLAEAWGDLRDSPEEKRQVIAEWKAKLTPESLAEADLAQAARIFRPSAPPATPCMARAARSVRT
ncbi:MAG: hypothetical protein R3F11_20125 [Verrucomicrobiales bacterium]